jgi:hypothetical protein
MASGVRFRGERQDLEEMLGNLVDNACKWAQARVSVEVTPEHGDGAPVRAGPNQGSLYPQAGRVLAVELGRGDGAGSCVLPGHCGSLYYRYGQSHDLHDPR